MRYKVGDKVKVKTWEQLEDECGLDSVGDIEHNKCSLYFTRGKEKELNELYPDRIVEIVEISNINDDYYHLKDLEGWNWSDYLIEELVSGPEPIESRFEILDL